MWFPADLIFHWICNMPNFEAIVILTILGGIDVNKDHWKSIHGHKRSHGSEQQKTLWHILQCSGFFWYTSFLCSKTLSLEAIRGQWRTACGQSFGLKLALTYFLCNKFIFLAPALARWMQPSFHAKHRLGAVWPPLDQCFFFANCS